MWGEKDRNTNKDQQSYRQILSFFREKFFSHVLSDYEQQYNIILFGCVKKLTFEASVLFRWIQLVTGLKRKDQILFLLSHFFDTNKKHQFLSRLTPNVSQQFEKCD